MIPIWWPIIHASLKYMIYIKCFFKVFSPLCFFLLLAVRSNNTPKYCSKFNLWFIHYAGNEKVSQAHFIMAYRSALCNMLYILPICVNSRRSSGYFILKKNIYILYPLYFKYIILQNTRSGMLVCCYKYSPCYESRLSGSRPAVILV